MSTRALAIAFSALGLTILVAGGLVGFLMLKDHNPDAMDRIAKTFIQDPPTVDELRLNFVSQTLGVSRDTALRGIFLAEETRKGWIAAEFKEQLAFCFNMTVRLYPDRSQEKQLAIAGVFHEDITKLVNSFEENDATSIAEIAAILTTLGGDEFEIRANEAIKLLHGIKGLKNL
jgi:hypothetical protein